MIPKWDIFNLHMKGMYWTQELCNSLNCVIAEMLVLINNQVNVGASVAVFIPIQITLVYYSICVNMVNSPKFKYYCAHLVLL